MIYFTSDLHLSHRRILEFEPRRLQWCQSLDEMDDILINDILSLNSDDTLIIAGDFLFQQKLRAAPIFERLADKKCEMVLVLGNHDEGLEKRINLKEHFVEVTNLLMFRESGQLLNVCHYPIFSWNDMKNGSLMLHGHVHSRPMAFKHKNLFHVGVDSQQYDGRMISLRDIRKLIENRDV